MPICQTSIGHEPCRSRSSIDSLYSTLSLSMGWSLSGPLSHSRSRTATPLGLVYTNSVMTGARRNDVFPEVMAEALAGLRPAQPAALDHQDCSSLYSRQRSGLSLWSLLRSFPTEQEPHKVPECLLFFGFCARRRMDLVLQGLDD